MIPFFVDHTGRPLMRDEAPSGEQGTTEAAPELWQVAEEAARKASTNTHQKDVVVKER